MLKSLLCVLGLTLLICLGFWQLNRAEQKRQLLNDIHHKQQSAPILFERIPQKQQARAFLPVLVFGEFINNQQIFLDNQFYQHQAGYDVLTPVKVNQSSKLLLVNRGWVPRDGTRRQLPRLDTIEGKHQLVGTLDTHANMGFALGNNLDKNINWPLLIQKVDFDKISQRIGQPLYPFVLLLDQKSPYAFVNHRQAVIIPPNRHLAYAAQWFGLAIIFLLVIIANLRNKHEVENVDN